MSKTNHKINLNCVYWLEKILRERIHENINLNINNQNVDKWEINLKEIDLKILIPISHNFFKNGVQNDMKTFKIDLKEYGFDYLIENLIAPGLDNPGIKLVEYKDNTIQVNYDFIGLTYWMLCRCEEINASTYLLDKYKRFKASTSHAFRNNYLQRPIVDEWLLFFKELIKRFSTKINLKKQIFKIQVTHDVDEPSRFKFIPKRLILKNTIKNLIKFKNINEIYLAPFIRYFSNNYLHSKDPNNTFDMLMNISEEKGHKSFFYFMTGVTNNSIDASYKINNKIIIKLLKSIHSRGHFIGLHPSYGCVEQKEYLLIEAKRLRDTCIQNNIYQEIWGGRMHYLRWKSPTTAYGWADAGFNYDSTLTYACSPGFRCGTCHEYPMFDPVENRFIGLRQRPLIFMESSVISKTYLGYGYSNKSYKLVADLKERCKLVGGQFTILWHNCHFQNKEDLPLYLHTVNN